MEKDLKDYREKELRNYVIGNILIILLGTGQIQEIITATGTKNSWDAISAFINSGVIATLVYIYVYLIDSLIPGSIKDKLIWVRKGMPGTRVFSEIRKGHEDFRFSKEMALTKYKEVYREIDDAKGNDLKESEIRKIENLAWYSAYQRNEKTAQVYVANRDWLLCRDMFMMTIWSIAGFAITVFFLHPNPSYGFYCSFIICLIELGVTWLVARIKGERFVYNVIAKDIHRKEE